jgi:hypothetical protein
LCLSIFIDSFPFLPYLTPIQQVNAEVSLINGAYRGLVAAKPLAQGDLIMAVPEKLTFHHIYDDMNANADGFKQHVSGTVDWL